MKHSVILPSLHHFNIGKIYEQIAHNEGVSHPVIRGNFGWKGGVADSEVVWMPDSMANGMSLGYHR